MKNNYTKEDAKAFSEGNKILEEILLQCWEKGIQTIACCAGHYFKDYNAVVAKEGNKRNWRFKSEAEYLESHHGNIINGTAYIAFGKNDNDYNFIAHFLNENGVQDYCHLTIENINEHIGWTIHAETTLERDENIFNEKTDKLFSKLCDSIKTYDYSKKYYSPYVALFEKIKENLSNTRITLNNGGITIRTQEQIYLPSFKFYDNKKYGDYSYFAENNISTINQALEEIRFNNVENDLKK